MRYYETIYIVDPNLENSVLEKTMNQIGQELEKTKAKIINHRDWGKKRLAYQVAKQKYGSFILLQFEIDDLSKMQDFDQWLKLNNLILRHMTVSLDQKPENILKNLQLMKVKKMKILNLHQKIMELKVMLKNLLILKISKKIRRNKNGFSE